MKIDFLKIANYARWGTSALFATLALAGIVGVMLGNYLHIITVIGGSSMAYTIAKYW